MRHSGDVARLATTKWGVVWHVASRMLFGAPVSDAAPDTAVRRPEVPPLVGTPDAATSAELAGGQSRTVDRL
jgi:hypothetical protein